MRGIHAQGALLHTHGIATGSFRKLVDQVLSDEKVYVWLSSSDSEASIEKEEPAKYTFKYTSKGIDSVLKAKAGEATTSGWYSVSQAFKVLGEPFKQEIYESLTLTYDKEIASSNAALWTKFNTIWARLFSLMTTVQFYFYKTGFLYTIFEDCLANGVTYVEIKEGLFMKIWRDVERDEGLVEPEDIVKAFKETVDAFKAEHPKFVGAKLVALDLKFTEPEEVFANVQRLGRLMKKYPQYLAGYDLAGDENALRPMSDYVDALERGCAACAKFGVRVPLMVHAGETNDPWNTQIKDAVQLDNCERLGHAYALSRNPDLMKRVAEAGVVVECCPLSNQVLGLVNHLSNHPGVTMLRSGVKLVLCPDDAGIWHAGPEVAYDICAAAVAWGLTLQEVHDLLRGSLTSSTLGTNSIEGDRLRGALATFDSDWKAFEQRAEKLFEAKASYLKKFFDRACNAHEKLFSKKFVYDVRYHCSGTTSSQQLL